MNIKYIIYLFLVLLVFSACSEDDNTRTQQNQNQDHDPVAFAQNFGNDISRNFLGTIVDTNNDPIEGVMISIGNSSDITDSNGVFIINNATISQRFGYIKAEKTGYIHASRSIVPTDGTNKVRIMMLPETITGTTTSGTQETISLPNGYKVALEGDYIKPDGTAYDGTVNVIMHHINPSDETMTDQMPGMLYAANANNEERMLQTFGMLAVELRGDNGEGLNLAEGSTAEITVPLDVSLMANAPSTIPLWYFDEVNGYWIEDGEATLIGNTYVGTVSHFSFWNCDIPSETVSFCTTLINDNDNPIANMFVQITSSTYGTTSGFTNEDGEVCGYIPTNETLEINVYSTDICITESLHTSTIGPFTEDSTLDIIISELTSTELIAETVSGLFISCNGDPVTNGYVKLTYGNQISYSQITDGTFEINLLRCSDVVSFELEAVDYDNLEMAESQVIQFTSPLTNLGTIEACSEIESEFIQYQLDDNEPITRTVSFAGITGTGFLRASYLSQNFGGTSFVLDISNYTTPGDYPGDMGLGLSSDTPLSRLIIGNLNNAFEGTTTVINFGEVGEFITMTFSGVLRNPTQNLEFDISGQIQAIRQQ